jgi:minor extracellular serine protease Vpr
MLVFLASIFVDINFMMASELNSKLSPSARQSLIDFNSNNINKNNKKTSLQNIGGRKYIGGIIESDNLDIYLLNKYECIFTQFGNLATLLIPQVNYVELFSEIDFIYFQQDVKVGLTLDSAIKITKVDEIHSGLDLEFPYDGSGVVVGIIDFGFDFGHEIFSGENGKSRIKKIWLQNAYELGRKPRFFNYGIELNPEDFPEYKFDYPEISHGTHVASTAAGSRSKINSQISGVAQGADIVLVSPRPEDEISSTNLSGLLDGIKYIFDYAQEQGKPAVINLSLANHIGPHDGSALFDRACEFLVNEQSGRVLVTAAGNNGNSKTTIYSQSESIKTHPSFPEYEGENPQLYVDIWGEEGSEICLNVGSYYQSEISWKNKFCTDVSDINTKSYFEGDQTINYTVSTSESEFNGKPRIFFSYDADVGNILLEVTSSGGEFFLWHSGVGGSDVGGFSSLNLDGFVSGENKYQVGEIGGNSQAFITVGSYTSKNSFINIYNDTLSSSSQIGDVSSFSSRGPSANNSNKPDISAPGEIIVAAYNGYDSRSKENFSQSPSLLAFSNYIDGREQYLGGLQGTSMSSPIVSGIVALILQANPLLNYQEIKAIIRSTASGSGIWSPDWGFGKLDAFAAVERAKEYLEPFKEKEGLNIRNNVTGDILTFWVAGDYSNIQYQISDLQGRIFVSKSVPEQNIGSLSATRQNIERLVRGFYFLSIKSNEGTFTNIFFKE